MDLALGLPDHWYVVCPRPAVGPEPRPFRCCGRELRLHEAAGQVVAEPAGDVLTEQDGYVWLWHGDGPAPTGPGALPALRVPGVVWERGSVAVQAGWTDFVENTLDLIHPMHVHAWTHPSWWAHALGVRPVFEAAVTMTAGGWIAEADLLLPFGRRWRIMWQEFRLPDRVRLVMTPPRERPEEGVGVGAMEVVAFHPPEGRGRSRMEYALGRRAWPFERPGFREVPGGRWLHAQDRGILEGLALNRARFADWREAHVPPDAYTLLFRKVIAEAAAGRWEAGWRAFPSPITLKGRI